MTKGALAILVDFRRWRTPILEPGACHEPSVPGVGPAHHQFKHRLSPYPPLPETRSTILPTLRLDRRSA